MRAYLRLVATLSLILGACAAPAPASPTPDATIPTAPAVPDGWQVVTSDAGDVRIAAPPDLLVLDQASGILLQGEMVGGTTPIQVWVTSPRGASVQPAPGETLRAWLEDSGWAPKEGSGGITEVSDVSEREVWLPAGRALEVAITAQPGSPDASRVVAYAIETSDGFGVLQVLGQADVVEARRGDLRLVPLLVSFGDGS
jgi:hypothetical protein